MCPRLQGPGTLRVLLKDLAALAGPLIALARILAAGLLGWTASDAVASIAIGGFWGWSPSS
jgi:hypothetical protein